jgi:hypothetical protein
METRFTKSATGRKLGKPTCSLSGFSRGKWMEFPRPLGSVADRDELFAHMREHDIPAKEPDSLVVLVMLIAAGVRIVR